MQETIERERVEIVADDAYTRFEGNRDFVVSFARGLDVVQAFYNEKTDLSVAEVARKTGMSRAAARRLLMTLELLGFAESFDGSYRLRPAVLKLGYSYLTSASIPSVAQPILEQISEKVGESVALGVLEGEEIIYLARHTRSRVVVAEGLAVGSRLPAYCTAMGRVLLAGLLPEQLEDYLERAKLRRLTEKTVVKRAALKGLITQAAQDGFALVDGEMEPGLRSIAVPVRSASGEVVAAINVGAHVASVTIEEMKRRILPVLLDNAQLLAHRLEIHAPHKG